MLTFYSVLHINTSFQPLQLLSSIMGGAGTCNIAIMMPILDTAYDFTMLLGVFQIRSDVGGSKT